MLSIPKIKLNRWGWNFFIRWNEFWIQIQISLVMNWSIGWNFSEQGDLSGIDQVYYTSQYGPVNNALVSGRLAPSEAIDEEKVISTTSNNLGKDMKRDVSAVLKYLSTSLFTQRCCIHGSIRSVFLSIWYEFQTAWVYKIPWIPGCTNQDDPLTEQESAPTEMVQSALLRGHMCVHIGKGFDAHWFESNLRV